MKKEHSTAYEVTDKAKEDALELCYKQLNKWNLTMPDEDPLLFHFGLNDFLRIGEIEFWICNNIDAGYCGKYLFLFENQRCPNHYHKLKHETFNIIKGQVIMTVDGKDIIMNEGDVFAMKVKTKHTFTAVNGSALVLEVSNPCFMHDSYFSDPNIGIF